MLQAIPKEFQRNYPVNSKGTQLHVLAWTFKIWLHFCYSYSCSGLASSTWAQAHVSGLLSCQCITICYRAKNPVSGKSKLVANPDPESSIKVQIRQKSPIEIECYESK